MTTDAHAEASMLCLHRIFDRKRDCLDFEMLFEISLQRPKEFRFGTILEVRQQVHRSKARIQSIEPLLKALRVRRNETVAHMGTRGLLDPEAYVEAGKIKHKEIDQVFDLAATILREMLQLHSGADLATTLNDEGDYEAAIELLTLGLAAKTKSQQPRD
jgi:hypothetical protein